MATGIVFDIKEFTVHDGPGARVTVFLKGCPLRCVWCHNPEGLEREPQLLYRNTLCSGCNTCRKPCEHEECKGLGRCIHACPNGCLSIAGESLTAEKLASRLRPNAEMLAHMGGGITVSGGEPLMQADFVCELFARLREQCPGIHLAVQTSGCGKPEDYRRMVGAVDYCMQDIKLADPQAHKKYTGVGNGQIQENIKWLKESGIAFVFRVPLIPGITDTEENLRGIAEIAEDFPVELMPYNDLAGAKYPMVGREFALQNLKAEKMDVTKYFRNATMLH